MLQSEGCLCFKTHDGLHLFFWGGYAALSVPTMHSSLNISHYWNVPLLFGTRSEGLVYPEAKLFEERLVLFFPGHLMLIQHARVC